LQLKKIYPDWEMRDIRGNIITRLEKLDFFLGGVYGALVLAAAGMKRLRLENRISRIFDTSEILPACGQGIMAALTREGDSFDFLAAASNEESRLCALAERAFVRALGGDCSAPIAAFAEIDAAALTLRGFFFDGEHELRGTISGAKERAAELGGELGAKLGGGI
jgi:hydroxymethylbilane synthase